MSLLINTYKDICKVAGLQVKEDGSVFHNDKRYFVKSKPLYLPLPSVLADPSVSEKLIFHPLAEAAAKGESDVLEDLRNRMTETLKMSLARLFAFYTALGVGELKAALDPMQAPVMQVTKEISEKEAKDIMAVVAATAKGEGRKTPLIKIYLNRRGGGVEGKRFHRTAVVTFPLYQAAKLELKSKDKGYNLLGVSINKKGLNSLCRIMEFIFPQITEEEGGAGVLTGYNAGGFSLTAPFCDALFRAVGGLAATINENIKLFQEIEPSLKKLLVDEGWADVVENMDSMYNEISQIPVQPNADGKARVSDVQTAVLGAQPQQAAAAPAPAAGMQPQVHVPNAPAPQQQYVQPVAAAPVAAPVEPEFITTPYGVKRNPKFLPAMTLGGGGFGMAPPAGQVPDPFAVNHALLPRSSVQLTPQQLSVTPAGHPVQNPPPGYNPNPGYGMGGQPTGMTLVSNGMGGFVYR